MILDVNIPVVSMPRAMQLYQLMRVGVSVLTGILLAKTGLSTSEIGAWEALLFIGSVVVFTGINGLLQGISPVYGPLEKEGQKRFLFSVFVLFSAIGVGVFILFFVLQDWLVPFFTGLPQIAGFGWFALYLLLHIPSLPVEIAYLLLKKPWSLLLWGALGWGLYLPAVLVPAWMGWGTSGALQGLCLLAALKWLWTLWLLLQHGEFAWLYGDVRKYLRLSAPMVANSLTGNVILFFDTWLVAHWYSHPEIFAIFRYGSRELPLALALATALGTAMIPQVSAGLGAGLEEMKVRGTRLFHTIMPLTALLMLGAPWYFPLVFNPDFSAAAPLFQIGLLVTLSRVLLPNSILIGVGDTRIILGVGIAELVIKVLTGMLFIYWWGLPGVMWSIVVSYWFEKAALAVYLYRNRRIGLSEWLNLKVYGFYFLVLLGCYLISSML